MIGSMFGNPPNIVKAQESSTFKFNDPVYSVDTPLNRISSVTTAQLDNYIKKKKGVYCPLYGLGGTWVDAGRKYKVDAVYLMAHAIHESGWGYSPIAQDKNNIYGFKAYDVNPYINAEGYPSKEDCIYKCAKYISEQYLTPSGKYYQGPTLQGMNVHYATDPNWKNKICWFMNDFLNYVPEPIRTYQTSWHFNTPSNTEGWEAHNVEGVGYSVEDGGYFINPSRLDPWIQLDSVSLDTNKYNAIEINMASNCPDGNARIYFTTTDSPGYHDNKMVEFKIKNDGNWQTYTIYMANHNLWQGTITGLRIDPAIRGWSGTPLDTVGFNWIKLINTNKYLSADLNCDNKVNLADHAILMSFWGKDPSGANSRQSPDINQDGKVDLVDHSIMMSQWTG